MYASATKSTDQESLDRCFSRHLLLLALTPRGIREEIERLSGQRTLRGDLEWNFLRAHARNSEHIDRRRHIHPDRTAELLKALFELGIHADTDAGLCHVCHPLYKFTLSSKNIIFRAPLQ